MSVPTVSSESSRYAALRRMAGALGLSAAIVVALVGPLCYGIFVYHERAELLAFKAQMNAGKLSKYAYAQGNLWRYQSVRLAELIQLPASGDEPIRQRVTDAAGQLVLDDGSKLAGPLLRREAPIVVRGETIGRIEVWTPLNSFVDKLGLITLGGMLLGLGAYSAFRNLPLKALDRTIGALEQQNRRFDLALTNMSEGLCLFDADRRLVVCNAQYARMYGLDPAQLTPGLKLEEVMNRRIAAGVYAGAIPAAYARDVIGVATSDQPTTKLQELNDGRILAVKYQPISGGGWLATHEDITEQVRIQKRIAFMAEHDPLTELANRSKLREQLVIALEQAGDKSAVLFLDLDRFKEINDTLGHACGDALLKNLADRLRNCVRKQDIVARSGGDEFAILQLGSEQPKGAIDLATRILQELDEPFTFNGHSVVVGTSIGIAIAPADGNTSDDLLKNAALALYRAKSDGRGAYRFFEPEMDRRMQARRRLESDLRGALQRGEFQLYYQPLYNLERKEVCGCEALVRWCHPERGMLPPGEFIPLAEETGLIVPIGEWALRQACTDAAGWPDHLKVAVNVSAAQFKSPNLAGAVIQALAVAQLAPSRLEIEITESVMLEHNAAAVATLTQLHALGVRIALDDFGTGYSSLSTLRRFPFDKIKIDSSFVADLSVTNLDAIAVVRSVASLGVSLGMATTAEGVETNAQLELVRAEGCTEIQGYLIGRPAPGSQIGLLVQQGWKGIDAA
jgi:diguanylate cyclase (GGDEF)-like protein